MLPLAYHSYAKANLAVAAVEGCKIYNNLTLILEGYANRKVNVHN